MSPPAPLPDHLAERYGAPSRGRRLLLVGAATAVALVLLGWLAWTALFHASPQVSSELVGWDVVDDHEVVARAQVDVSGDTAGECRIRAMAEDHTVVGEVVFEVTGQDAGVVEESIRTERRATSVELIGCTTPDQPRPR